MLMKHFLPRNAPAMLLLAAFAMAAGVKADSGPVITDGYADVNWSETPLPRRGKGRPGDTSPWLRAEQPYVASRDEGTGENAPRCGP